ncbi:heat shock protein 70E [Coccomyxa subellipsoidea C-169]|uniref:Heat shock protein 70E n=1 Tax=Coccomyxa subellipsoidea (strain C-169) TaxID=574566 RepID=I0YIL2_COCSC|nr:heat shock protein 70E [Coccomyxa subellipsoidea C-169]EIE18231.1 heat shock protein 70E [Coccomyxa subellipsoidea C-169]|eukprot:XP_005642775.1 heat shock protein 70E [Coccomyxa subellipsoidea C-169]
MSVAGIDIGDQKSCIAVARKRGIDVLMNKESKRETPSLVSFGTKQRQLGTDAAGSLTINPKNTLFGLKRLLGKNFSNPDVQRDLPELPYNVSEGPDGGILINVDYLGERQSFTPEQIVAAIIVDMKDIAEVDGSPVTDCVLSVPTYYLETERYAMLAAAKIAGVNCLRLINETTATALAYGIYKTDLPETDPINVVFIDAGHTAFQVSIVAFKKGQLRVLSHAWDRNLGGRDLDNVLFNHFANEFKEKYKLDVRTNPRSAFRLRLGCEKLKKILSSILEAPLNVECLMNDIDFRSSMTREQFEELAQPVLQRARAPLATALEQAKISLEDIASVEVVGGSSRVPALLTTMRDFFKKEPSRTLNATEVVCRGCALNCAMLSPIFRVRDFEVIEAFPFGIEFQWDKDGERITSVLFERNGPIPSAKMLTFFRNTAFTLTARYTDDSPVPEGFDRTIGTFEIGPPVNVPTDGSNAKIKVKVKLNLHGVVGVESAQQIEEEEYEETVKVYESASAKASTAPGPADGPAPMETEAEGPKKRRTKKLQVPFKVHVEGLSDKIVQDFIEMEGNIELQKKRQDETNERKNAVEAYVYGLRNQLSDALAPFVTEQEQATVSDKLNQTEDWLYEEGEDESKGVYEAKLKELQAMGEPLLHRAREAQARPAAAAALTSTANRLIAAATTNDAKHAHIPQDDKDKVVAEARKALEWLEEKQRLQGSLRKTDDPVLSSADIKKREDTIVRFSDPILSKSAPPPPKEDKKPEPKEAEKQEPAAASEEPMETDAAAGNSAPEVEMVD